MKIIDITKLEKVVEKQGKTVSRCPACAKSGGDRKAEHLVVYPDGRFGCAAYPEDKQHRREILALVGVEGGCSSWPKPVVIKRPACADREPRRLFTLSLTKRSEELLSRSVDEELVEYLREAVYDPSQEPLPELTE